MWIFKNSIYPHRFKSLLSPTEITRAKAHLNKLWKVIKSEVDLEPVSSTSTAEQDDLQDEEADPLEALLKSKETTRRNTARRAANPIDAEMGIKHLYTSLISLESYKL